MLELWGMWSTSLLALLPSTFWPGLVSPDKGPVNGFNRTKWWLVFTFFYTFNLHINAELNCLK